MMKIKYFVASFLFFIVGQTYAINSILTIAPKDGTTLPTEVIVGYPVSAYYTVTNNTGRTLTNLYVSNLPENVSQVTAGGVYPDTCGTTFTLAPGASVTLELTVSGACRNSATNYLFISLPGGRAGAGTAHPLNVIESLWEPIKTDEDKFEIVYVGGLSSDITSFTEAYAAGGPHQITAEEWDSYTPPTGYTKNTSSGARYPLYNERKLISSSGNVNGEVEYVTIDGYTWYMITKVINAVWPFDSEQYDFPANQGPFYAGSYIENPPAGVVKVNANYKNQIFKYYACEGGVPFGTPGAVQLRHYSITDEWGNKHIMIGSDFGTPEEVKNSFDSATLPDGWTKEYLYFTEDFILSPAVNDDVMYEYLFIRTDSADSYHQYYWNNNIESNGGLNVCSQIQAQGMPIWGGLTDGPLIINNGFDNLVYGGGGVREFIFPLLTNLGAPNVGTNTIIGFNPTQGDRLNFKGQVYTVINTQFGMQITVQSGLVVILSQLFLFDDSWVLESAS